MKWPVMNRGFDTLRNYPEIAIFLVLLAGVLVGQLNITLSPNVKAVFFLMFLFAVGCGVGPQFFRGLKSDGLPQVFFAVSHNDDGTRASHPESRA